MTKTSSARGGRIPGARLYGTSTLDAIEHVRGWLRPGALSAVSTWDVTRRIQITTTLGHVWFVWQSTGAPDWSHDWSQNPGGRIWGPGTQWSLLVTELADDRFEVVRPFTISIAAVDDDSFVAEFPEANIAMAGETAADAYERLIENLTDVFDLYTREESSLGPGPRHQLAILRKYIAHRP